MRERHIKDLSIRVVCETEAEAKLFEKEFFKIRKSLGKKLKRKLSYELIFLIKETGKHKGIVSKHK